MAAKMYTLNLIKPPMGAICPVFPVIIKKHQITALSGANNAMSIVVVLPLLHPVLCVTEVTPVHSLKTTALVAMEIIRQENPLQ